MPKVTDMLVSKYLRKEDVDDEIVVTMKDVALEEMPGDGHETRWVLYFKELAKGLVLNATTIKLLDKTFGSHSDDWTGKKVTLYVDPSVQYRGQIVGGLRLRPLKPPKKPSTPLVSTSLAPPPTPATEEFDDQIPM